MNIAKLFRKKAEATHAKQMPRMLIDSVVRRAESQARRDIADWQRAVAQAKGTSQKKQALLQRLYSNITTDALLSSQIDLRIDKSQSAAYCIVDENGTTNEDAEAVMHSGMLFDSLVAAIVESKIYGHSLCELSTEGGTVGVTTLPRWHVYPADGLFYPDEYGSDGLPYRECAEYGKWIMEFGSHSADDLGMLNETVPHVLMKRFAQSCWSELCEVYGIPPMVVKTNTQDPDMVSRIKKMFAEQGSNSKFLADTMEQVEWATGVATNGDVFRQLIALCNSEISMRISGAVVGQDTVNGNRSKEESSIGLLNSIVAADQRYIEACFNSTVLPALARIGTITEGLRLKFDRSPSIESLWNMTNQAAAYFDIDPEWIKTTFGIEVTGAKAAPQGLSIGDDGRFFV